MNPAKFTDPNLPLPREVAECFQGVPERKHFVEGAAICRLRTNRQNVIGNTIWGSPGWFPKPTVHQIVGRADQTGKSVTVSARSGLAVTREFNRTLTPWSS
jgi:hypothetical protein